MRKEMDGSSGPGEIYPENASENYKNVIEGNFSRSASRDKGECNRRAEGGKRLARVKTKRYNAKWQLRLDVKTGAGLGFFLFLSLFWWNGGWNLFYDTSFYPLFLLPMRPFEKNKRKIN